MFYLINLLLMKVSHSRWHIASSDHVSSMFYTALCYFWMHTIRQQADNDVILGYKFIQFLRVAGNIKHHEISFGTSGFNSLQLFLHLGRCYKQGKKAGSKWTVYCKLYLKRFFECLCQHINFKTVTSQKKTSVHITAHVYIEMDEFKPCS